MGFYEYQIFCLDNGVGFYEYQIFCLDNGMGFYQTSSDVGLTSGNRMSELDLTYCPEFGFRISDSGIRKQYAFDAW